MPFTFSLLSGEWSPDSRWFLTTTTHPRLRVDNGFKVFKYDGTGPIAKVDIPVLYQAMWRPAPAGTYPERPVSPGRAAAAAAAGIGTTKARAYRPPGARAAGGNSVAAQIQKLRMSGGRATAAAPAPAPAGRRGGATVGRKQPVGLPVGAAPPPQPKQSGPAPAEDVLEAAAAADPAHMTAEEILKVRKKLLRKVQQIDALKAKLAEGASMNPAQQAKLDSEEEVRAVLAKYT